MIKIKEQLSLENIHKYITQEEIWRYIVNKNINTNFSLREENHKSCTIKVGSYGDLIMKDWGNPNQPNPETWWKYLMRTKYSDSLEGFLCALEEVRRAFGLNNIIKYSKFNGYVRNIDRLVIPRISTKEPSIIEIKAKIKNNKIFYSDEDINYWKQYGITVKKLKEKLVIPIEYFILNRRKYQIGKLCFAYLHGEEDGIERITIYNPLSKENKWIKNTHKNTIQNKNFISKTGERLIIQSSYKDIMTMEELGYKDIVAPNSESTIFSTIIMDDFKNRFKNIIYFGNNDFSKKDNPGIGYCKLWNSIHGIPYITTPNNTTSDISDYYKKYGETETIKLLNKCLNQ